MIKTTTELRFGDRVALPGHLVRTVARVTASSYVNRSSEPILYVHYLEGRTDEWSEANSAIGSSRWTLLPCVDCGYESCDCTFTCSSCGAISVGAPNHLHGVCSVTS